MSNQVVTELVIDSNTSGADDFTRAMDGAEQAASRGVAAATGFSAGVVALGAGALGAIAGIKSLLDQVVEANKGLADLQTLATRTGLSLTDLQGVKFGGALAGISDNQINAGLEKSAALLNDASRNANSLSKELDANGISVKNANGQLISENQLLTIAANLIKNANNPGDQLVIAQMLGFTKEWIPLLEQGGAAMNSLSAEAKDAGAVIDDDVIARAVDFDSAWRKSSVEFSTYMKSALADLLPYIDDLIEKTAAWIKTLPGRADIQKASDQSFKDFNEATGIPDNGVITVDADKLSQATKDFQDAPIFSTATWLNFGRALAAGFGFLGGEQAAQSIPGFAASQITEPSYPTAAQMDAAFDKANPPNPGSRSNPLPTLSASDYKTGGSKVAAKDVGSNSLDHAIAQLEKHTAQTEADTAAVGLGAGALAEMKAQAALLTAAQQAGVPITQALADKIQDLAQDAGDAAAALAKAKVQNEAAFGTNTAFLSADDVAIATKLKDVYPDVATALNSAEAAQLRFNSAAKGLSSSIENDLVNGLTDIADGTKTASQGFADLSNAVVKSIEQMVIKIAIVQPLMNALQQSLSGSGLLSGLFGGGAAAVNANGSISGALGATSVGGAPLVGLHDGGIVGLDATFSRYVHPSYFDQAPRFHGGGIAGDEVPIIAKKGEGVFTEGQMAALGRTSQAPQVNVTLIESPTAQGSVSQKTNSNGGVDIEVAIAQIAAKSAAQPGAALNRVLVDQLGSSQRLASR